MPSKKRWAVAIGLAIYLYFLLPLTAAVFYELYHLIEIDAIYWGYSGFKFAGYYFDQWPHQELACVGVALLVLLVPSRSGKTNPVENAK